MTTPEAQARYAKKFNAKPEAKEAHRLAERARRERLAAGRPPRPPVELKPHPPRPVPEPIEAHRPKKEVVAEYNYMLDQARVNDWSPKCEAQPERYVLYEATPTAEYAETLCDGCPMKALCLEFATIAHQGWGVWGGTAFVDGKPYTRTSRQERMVAA